ncbi:Nif3-like dinuclear metal center hexameric protein [Paenibacillus puldeungensis]|uniref:GTP cyclohydrolase 1 type 2 homolog n=1 Tax=Paenibacillus puldeungensis TaxID=696536 RepID=A0ABW3RZD6_9BACL
MKITVRDVVGSLLISDKPLIDSVDQLLIGCYDEEVRGIATTFAATCEVIEKASNLGVNLLISHEGIYYSHQNNPEWLAADPVCSRKRQIIEQTGIAIYRDHDHCHRQTPDIIMAGLLEALDWENAVAEMLSTSAIVQVAPIKLQQLAAYIKTKLGLHYVRVTGQLSDCCSHIGILVGYRGGGSLAIPLLRDKGVDVIIAGEGPEWETPEYVRDAVHQGGHQALITLGHAESEQPGMQYLAKQLQKQYPQIPVHFLPVDPLFHVL